jgi:hypothetical protein
MRTGHSVRTGFVIAALAALTAAGPAAAQAPIQPQVQQRMQVVSLNPFGLLLELFNAEYERVVTESTTAGFGGSTATADDQRYINADVFWRFYPDGTPLEGWAFGAKLGLTSVAEEGTFVGYGFDVNRSWLLGVNRNFYVGMGFGLKRLLGTQDRNIGLSVIPTIRIINIGIAF